MVTYCLIARSVYRSMDDNDERFEKLILELKEAYMQKQATLQLPAPILVPLIQQLIKQYHATEINDDYFLGLTFDSYFDVHETKLLKKQLIFTDVDTLMSLYTEAEIADRMQGYESRYLKEDIYQSELGAYLFLELLKSEPPISIVLESDEDESVIAYHTSGYIPLRLEAALSLSIDRSKEKVHDALSGLERMLVKLWLLGYLNSAVVEINDICRHDI